MADVLIVYRAGANGASAVDAIVMPLAYVVFLFMLALH